ncbi:hypothetical protein C8J57DRAFT_1290499 [Mycena rebaudengoi]|nr:hypothetical protein C8J57DRAFT_1290499 [Mycena rebaudengoi]
MIQAPLATCLPTIPDSTTAEARLRKLLTDRRKIEIANTTPASTGPPAAEPTTSHLAIQFPSTTGSADACTPSPIPDVPQNPQINCDLPTTLTTGSTDVFVHSPTPDIPQNVVKDPLISDMPQISSDLHTTLNANSIPSPISEQDAVMFLNETVDMLLRGELVPTPPTTSAPQAEGRNNAAAGNSCGEERPAKRKKVAKQSKENIVPETGRKKGFVSPPSSCCIFLTVSPCPVISVRYVLPAVVTQWIF